MNHKIDLKDRKTGVISGVSEVVSFDTDEVILLIDEDTLIIKGSEMHVTRLDVEKGIVEFEGLVDSAAYTKTKKVTAKGIAGRLFK